MWVTQLSESDPRITPARCSLDAMVYLENTATSLEQEDLAGVRRQLCEAMSVHTRRGAYPPNVNVTRSAHRLAQAIGMPFHDENEFTTECENASIWIRFTKY
jgi:hypothetical protein